MLTIYYWRITMKTFKERLKIANDYEEWLKNESEKLNVTIADSALNVITFADKYYEEEIFGLNQKIVDKNAEIKKLQDSISSVKYELFLLETAVKTNDFRLYNEYKGE